MPTNAIPANWPASRIYSDSKIDLVDRFHALMNLEYQGDKDARYLAYRLRENCRLAKAMSKGTVLPEPWSTEMSKALKTFKVRCEPLAEDAVFQDFSDQVKDLNFGSFNDDIPIHIKEAFADSGAPAAVATALAAFRRRPDNPTAMMVAETLSNLDILAYDPNFKIEGLSAADPAMRKDLFFCCINALQLRPGSALWPRLRPNDPNLRARSWVPPRSESP